MAEKYDCWACKKQVTATKNQRYRTHTTGDGEPCANSSEPVPEHILTQPVAVGDPPDVPRDGVDYSLCPQCERKVRLTRMGYFENHNTTPRGGDRCPVSGVRAKYARKREDVLLPGDEPASPVPKVTPVANRGLATVEPATGTEGTSVRPVHETNQPIATSSPELMTTSTGSSTASAPAPSTPSGALGGPEGSASADGAPPVLHLAPLLDDVILQPFSHILQPTPYGGPVKAIPMGDLAKELATKIKETFYSYSNRKTNDNRSAQTTLGPSEIGTPCDRRLAMALMGIPAVNAGGDGWAAFVGTCTHVGMAEIYTFADAGTGRYAVEMPVFLGVPTVPRGTTDLLDRRDGMVVDWKVMGTYSLKKFKTEGPSETYRTQAHVYGLGAERGGEKVKNVAIVGLPRAGSSLDEMHVWTEKYDRKFAQAALDRVEKIAQNVTPGDGIQEARAFATGDDCRYCPFHLKNDKEMKRGCPGK